MFQKIRNDCVQMSALQCVSGSVENCEFGLGVDPEQEELAQDLRRALESLRDQRDQLQRQQAGLRATVATITSVLKSKCSVYRVLIFVACRVVLFRKCWIFICCGTWLQQ